MEAICMACDVPAAKDIFYSLESPLRVSVMVYCPKCGTIMEEEEIKPLGIKPMELEVAYGAC